MGAKERWSTVALTALLSITFTGCTAATQEPGAGSSTTFTTTKALTHGQIASQRSDIPEPMMAFEIEGGTSGNRWVALDPEQPLPEAVRDALAARAATELFAPRGDSDDDRRAEMSARRFAQEASAATGKNIAVVYPSSSKACFPERPATTAWRSTVGTAPCEELPLRDVAIVSAQAYIHSDSEDPTTWHLVSAPPSLGDFEPPEPPEEVVFDITEYLDLESGAIEIDSAGGVSLDLNVRNVSKAKTIKYVDMELRAKNAVGDYVVSEIGGRDTAPVQITGPLEPAKREMYSWRGLWYNPTVALIEFGSIRIQYMDDTIVRVENSLISLAAP